MSNALKKYHKVSKHLSDEEHVLLRPHMFIGSTSKETYTQFIINEYREIEYIPGLLKLVNEIIDNSVDVAIKTNFKYGNKIEIDMTEDYVRVKDNGTGIPVVKVQDRDGKDVWNPVMSWTYTKAGTNFDDSIEDARQSIGMNGVGSTVVSIFSKKFVGETCDGSKKLILHTSENNNLDDVKVGRSKKNYTQVYFEPDFTRFGIKSFDQQHIDVIRDRIEKLAAIYPEITFVFNEVKVSYKETSDFLKHFESKSVYEKDSKSMVAFLPNTSEEFRFISVVNGLNVTKGGSHIDYIMDTLASYLRPAINKKYKIDVVPSQIKQHLFVVNFTREFPNLKFDSQTKERITNDKAEIESVYKELDFEKLAQKIIKTEDIIMPIVEFQLMKAERAERKKLQAEQKKALKEKVAKHIPPKSRDVAKNVLYIVEGDSAKGNFMTVRDRNYHGIYPLKGKFVNVSRKNKMDILQHNECKELMSILGLRLGEPVPDRLHHNYGKIYITADADVDGYCITAQLINFFKLWPELFERGIVHILYTPIMEIRKSGKIVKSFYTLSDYKKYKVKSGETIKYLKGLGSLGVNQYKKYLIEQPLIEAVQDDENCDDILEVVFGDDAKLRKEWLE